MVLEPHWNLDHLVHQLFLCSALPWGLPVQKLIGHDPDGPNIVLDRVNVSLQGLWRHVKRTAHVVPLSFGGVSDLLCESKIRDLGLPVFHENVGQLQVSVQETIFSNLDEPGYNILENLHGLVLRESPFLLEQGREISFITEFCDDVT